MHILLVQPKVSSEAAYPLALAAMIPLLEGGGHRVSGVDLVFEDQGRITELIANGVDWVGATVMHHNAAEVAQWMDPLRENRRVKTFVAGALPTLDPASALARTGADFAIIGEAEETVADLIDAARPTTVCGLAWRQAGVVRRSPPRISSPLELLPIADRNVFDVDRYSWAMRSTAVPYTPVYTSRGCRRKCPYCPVPAMRPRGHDARSAAMVVAEWAWLAEAKGIRSVHIEDDAFLADPDRVRGICAEIERTGLKLSWELVNGIRPDQVATEEVDPRLLQRMADAGCSRIVFSFEHISAAQLPAVGQPMAMARLAVERARDAGLRVGGYFIVGLPGVGLDATLHSIGFALGLGLDDANFVPLYESPGSAYAGAASSIDATAIHPRHAARICRAAQLAFFGNPHALSRLSREMLENPKTFPALAEKAWELLRRGGPIPLRDTP